MKNFAFWIWQWIWGFPQNLIGLILFCIHRKKPHGFYHGAITTDWEISGSLGLGMFLFLGKSARAEEVRVHEFGHSVQSLILGPLFLPVMGIPSFLWCNLPVCQKLRREKGISYYVFYPEKSANFLGKLVTNEPCNL